MASLDIAQPIPTASRAAWWERISVYRLMGFGLIGVLLVLWELSVRLKWIVSDAWPSVSSVLQAGFEGVASGELLLVLGSTLVRAGTGFAIGTAIGAVLGLLFAISDWTRRLLSPLVELLRPLPVPALVPPLVLLLGVSDPMKITVVALTVMFPVLTNMYQGVLAVDGTLIAVAKTFHVSRVRTIFKIVLPATLPYLLAGMRIGLALALIVAVVAEMIAGNQGIGHYLVLMQYAIRPQDMYAAVMLLSASGYLINKLFVRLERRLIHWYALGDKRNEAL